MSPARAEQHHESAEQPRKGIRPVTFFVSLIAVLVAGILLGTYRYDIFATVAPAFGVKTSQGTLDTELLQRTYRELVANYDGTLDNKALSEGAARGMVAAAGDEYTTFFSASDAKEFEGEMSGSIGGGIGAQVGLRDEQVTFVKIIPDTPAERAGLKAGDSVLAINDESTDGLTVDAAVTKIRGEVGTTVKLKIKRGDTTSDFSITREEITAPSVTKEIRGNLGIVTISRFDDDTAARVRQVADDFKSSGVKGVIVDLRGNPGGYLTAARDVAGVWLKKKVVVVEKEGDKVIDELSSGNQPVLEGMPTIVLVDGGSASASEIVAGALQDHKAATLLGETTYGKGSVQRLVPLLDGTLLKVTVARWYTPHGKNITKEGIKPDIEVKMTADQLRAGDDVQLKAAIKRLQ